MFMYYPNTGFWSCTVLDAEYPLAKLGTEMSDEEAARIGCEFVRTAGLRKCQVDLRKKRSTRNECSSFSFLVLR